MDTKGFRVFLMALCAIIFLLFGFAAYMGRDSKDVLFPIAVGGALLILLYLQCNDLSKEVLRLSGRQKLTVLISNLKCRQWYATVEIDREGRLLAPEDPNDRVLSVADVAPDVHVLRAPHYREYPSSIVMLGTNYFVPRVPFGE